MLHQQKSKAANKCNRDRGGDTCVFRVQKMRRGKKRAEEMSGREVDQFPNGILQMQETSSKYRPEGIETSTEICRLAQKRKHASFMSFPILYIILTFQYL